MTYRFLPHTADIKVAVDSETLDGLLRDGVELCRQLFVGDSPVEVREHRAMLLERDSIEELLLGFLQDLLYRYATDAFVPAAIEITRATPTSVRGAIGGEVLDPARHATEPEVKAVTRHGFVVHRTPAGWHMEVVFDV